MEAKVYHKLLERQIRRFIPPEAQCGLDSFLEQVSEFYENAQKERKLLETTLDSNSKELEAQNKLLKQQYEALKTQESLRTARDEAIKEKEIAVAANRAKDTFLANMSHELRTPLNTINGFSQVLLARDDTPEKVKVFIQKIYTSGLHLLSLVNTILDHAKMESNTIDVIKRDVLVQSLVDEVTLLLEPMLAKKNIVLLTSISDSATIHIDRQLIKQVLLNLLSNAIKFSHSNERIKIEFIEGQEKCEFRIIDRGVGIQPDKIATLFDPFVQVREAQNDSIKGTGLGLAIVKKIVELHGGNVWINSVVGRGSQFCFSIPTLKTGDEQSC